MLELSKYEKSIIKKFIFPCVVADEDQVIVDRYSGFGYFRSGFNHDDMTESLTLTEFGLSERLGF